MRVRYGCPYQGSKNKVAKQIIDFLPRGKRLVDLFGGGGAITHCGALSGKWDSVLYNEYNPFVFDYVHNAFEGKYKDENRWISREAFHRLKGSDPVVAFCWSFGNDGQTYLYGKYLEPWKQALHYARVFRDYSWLREFGIESDGSRKGISQHTDEYWAKYVAWYKATYKSDTSSKVPCETVMVLSNKSALDRLQNIERINRLSQIINTNITFSCGSYDEYKYQEGDVVYCDPPYENTHNYNGVDFDHKKFYDWVASRPYEVFFSSYEISDPRFVVVKELKLHILSNIVFTSFAFRLSNGVSSGANFNV